MKTERTFRALGLVALALVIAATALMPASAEEDVAQLKRRLSADPNDYAALTALGKLSQDRGDRKAALRYYADAVRISPDYPPARLMRGRLNFAMRRHEEAIADLEIFKKSLEALPEMDAETKSLYIDGLYALSDIYFTLKMYKDARRETESIIRTDPKEQGAYYNMGVYYYVYEHSRPNAYKYFKKVIDVNPDTEAAKSAAYAIEFMRTNPDSRVTPDFSFIDQEYRN